MKTENLTEKAPSGVGYCALLAICSFWARGWARKMKKDVLDESRDKWKPYVVKTENGVRASFRYPEDRFDLAMSRIRQTLED